MGARVRKLGGLSRRGRHATRLGIITLAAGLMASCTSTVLATVTSPEQATTASIAPQPTTFPKPADPDADLRAAIATAKRQNQPVHVLSADTEDSWTWAYPDSHLTVEQWAGPARVRRADGSLDWIDTTLEARDGALVPKVAQADVRISAGGDTHLASLERADKDQFFG